MLRSIWIKVVGVAAAGAAVGGLGVAGALPGPFESGGSEPTAAPAELPEPAQPGQSFAAAMQEWAACVGEAAPAHVGPEEFDPVAACGERPVPADFDVIEGPDDDETPPVSLPEGAEAGKAFAVAMQEWAGCVGDAAAERGEGEHDDPFDPFAACGDLPHASDFGIGGGPDGVGPPEGVPGGPPDGLSTGGPSGVPRPPAEVPAGPPSGTPVPPAGIPGGPPEGAGPPSGTAGPPVAVPGGRP